MENIINDKSILQITSNILKVEKKAEALCNDVYLLHATNGKYILKIAKGKYRQDELDKEVSIISKLKDYVLLPKILFYSCNENFSYFLMEYIDGIKLKGFTDDKLKKIAFTLKKIHSFSSDNGFVDFDDLLCRAKCNLESNRLDISEFIQYKAIGNPEDVLDFLIANKPKNIKKYLLHGDFRPKNMLIADDKLYVFDFGLSFYGDIYYDFAIFKYYLSDEEFSKFLTYYGIFDIDEERLKYNELLSLFLNV